MRAFRLHFGRTLGRLFASPSVGLGAAGLLAVTAFLFARAIGAAEGTSADVPAVWARASSWTLPALSALLTMRLIADDRRSGLLDLVLTAPAPESAYVLGRWAGAYLLFLLTVAFGCLIPLVVLPGLSAGAGASLPSAVGFLPAFLGMALQGALWCAVGTLVSACCRQAALAAAVSFTLTALVPRALYATGCAWDAVVRARFPVFPGDVFLSDAATGAFAVSECAAFVAFSALALFLAVHAVAAARWCGRGGRRPRLASLGLGLSAFLFAALAVACFRTFDVRWEWPFGTQARPLAARTREILAATDGRTQVTCLFSRRTVAQRDTVALLKAFSSAARARGGRLDVYVADPRWDVSVATVLARMGVKGASVVFERGARRIVLPAAEADEAACASAVQRLALPASYETVYWTTGHGEASFASYDALTGMSALARTLRRDGYELKNFAPAEATAVPDDCGVLVVAGARTPFSKQETALVDGFLRRGGRLLVFLSPETRRAGLASLLAEWGVATLPHTVLSSHTQDGGDVLVSAFADHVLTRPLADTAVRFRYPAAFVSTVATGTVATASFTALASSDERSWGESAPRRRPCTQDVATEPSGPFVLAAAVEHGGGSRRDLALRPTRLVVIGDAGFVSDGALAARANANGDFVRNAVAWLAGLDVATASGVPAHTLVTGMDRAQRLRFTCWSVVGVPAAFAALFLLACGVRRMR